MVEVVVVNSNRIKYIGGKFFDYLPNLRRADFSYNECIDGKATELSDIKEKIKQKCDVPDTEFERYTTILPDGLTYWDWINTTATHDGAVAGAAVDSQVNWKVLQSSVG